MQFDRVIRGSGWLSWKRKRESEENCLVESEIEYIYIYLRLLVNRRLYKFLLQKWNEIILFKVLFLRRIDLKNLYRFLRSLIFWENRYLTLTKYLTLLRVSFFDRFLQLGYFIYIYESKKYFNLRSTELFDYSRVIRRGKLHVLLRREWRDKILLSD